jgi:hypothetical protein
MQALMKAVPERAGLLIVGDIDQLPSVGPSQVLADSMTSTMEASSTTRRSQSSGLSSPRLNPPPLAIELQAALNPAGDRLHEVEVTVRSGRVEVRDRALIDAMGIQLRGDGVRGLEPNAADIACQAIRVLGHDLDGIGTIGLENPNRSRRGDVRAALRAMLIANAYLEAEIGRLTEAVSSGFARGRMRKATQRVNKI